MFIMWRLTPYEYLAHPIVQVWNPRQFQKNTLNPRAAEFTPPKSTNLYVSANKAVLLQTARTVVYYNPDIPHSQMDVRIILDSGSQQSYVSDRVSSALSLVPKGEQQMYIATFGSGRKDPQICQVVSFGMRVREGRDVILSLFNVPTICEPLVVVCKAV